MDLAATPAREMARAVREGEIGALELLDRHLQRIEELNPELNAIVLPRFEEAREEAELAERAGSGDGGLGPLHGLPFTAKEAIDVARMPTPNGSKLLEHHVARDDAPVIRSMREAGAILLGKTNVSEFSAFYDSVNLVFGATRNPHDPTRSAGGSSGGEAAAVAAALSPAGVGADLGSSTRQPAHFVGIFGMKPSRGLISNAGYSPGTPPLAFDRFAAMGPMTRTADDLELLLRVMSVHPLHEPAPARRVAVFEEDGLQPVSRVCRQAVRRAADALADAGWDLVDQRPPGQAEVRDAYDRLLYPELAAVFWPLVEGREDELSDHGKRSVGGLGGLERSLDDYVAAATRIAELELLADAWFERNPVALCPVAPTPAPPLGEGITEIDGEPPAPGGVMTLCTYANALGLPAVSVPAMRDEQGLPVGVQVITARERDLDAIAVSRELEAALGGYIAPPDGSG